METEEKLLTITILKLQNGELQSANDIFDFLFKNNFFKTEQCVNSYTNLINKFFNIDKQQSRKFVYAKILENISGKFKTPQEVFDYVNKLGFFGTDKDGKAEFMYKAEQLTAEMKCHT